MKQRKEEPSLLVWRITALLSALLFLSLCWILADTLFSFTDTEESYAVVVPSLCGMQEAEIRVEKDFLFETEYRYDSEIPRGVVISQSPRAGSRQKLSPRRPVCRVTLVVSLGEEGDE